MSGNCLDAEENEAAFPHKGSFRSKMGLLFRMEAISAQNSSASTAFPLIAAKRAPKHRISPIASGRVAPTCIDTLKATDAFFVLQTPGNPAGPSTRLAKTRLTDVEYSEGAHF